MLASALGEGVGGLALKAACWLGARGHHGLPEGVCAAGRLGLHRLRLLWLYWWFLDLGWRLHVHGVPVCRGGILSKWVAGWECVLWLLRLWAIPTKACPCKLGLQRLRRLLLKHRLLLRHLLLLLCLLHERVRGAGAIHKTVHCRLLRRWLLKAERLLWTGEPCRLGLHWEAGGLWLLILRHVLSHWLLVLLNTLEKVNEVRRRSFRLLCCDRWG